MWQKTLCTVPGAVYGRRGDREALRRDSADLLRSRSVFLALFFSCISRGEPGGICGEKKWGCYWCHSSLLNCSFIYQTVFFFSFLIKWTKTKEEVGGCWRVEGLMKILEEGGGTCHLSLYVFCFWVFLFILTAILKCASWINCKLFLLTLENKGVWHVFVFSVFFSWFQTIFKNV